MCECIFGMWYTHGTCCSILYCKSSRLPLDDCTIALIWIILSTELTKLSSPFPTVASIGPKSLFWYKGTAASISFLIGLGHVFYGHLQLLSKTFRFKSIRVLRKTYSIIYWILINVVVRTEESTINGTYYHTLVMQRKSYSKFRRNLSLGS
jgi:hypothetical protein